MLKITVYKQTYIIKIGYKKKFVVKTIFKVYFKSQTCSRLKHQCK